MKKFTNNSEDSNDIFNKNIVKYKFACICKIPEHSFLLLFWKRGKNYR